MAYRKRRSSFRRSRRGYPVRSSRRFRGRRRRVGLSRAIAKARYVPIGYRL